jgi:hypothetical protein
VGLWISGLGFALLAAAALVLSDEAARAAILAGVVAAVVGNVVQRRAAGREHGRYGGYVRGGKGGKERTQGPGGDHGAADRMRRAERWRRSIPALRARLAALRREGEAIWDRFDVEVRQQEWHPFVAADYRVVESALLELRRPGATFLEWGSAAGVITIMADLLGFEAYGIEIDGELVHLARALAERFESGARFALGSFLPAGYEWRAPGGDRSTRHHRPGPLRVPGARPAAGGLRRRLRLPLDRGGARDARRHAHARRPGRAPAAARRSRRGGLPRRSPRGVSRRQGWRTE